MFVNDIRPWNASLFECVVFQLRRLETSFNRKFDEIKFNGNDVAWQKSRHQAFIVSAHSEETVATDTASHVYAKY